MDTKWSGDTRMYTRTLTLTNMHNVHCTYTHTHKRAAEIYELAEPQLQGIAKHTHARAHTHARTHAHAHKRAAGINEIAVPDASAAWYPALFFKNSIFS